VRSTWHLATDDPDERTRFCDLDATLAQPWVAAGPANTRRHARRVDAAGRTWFVKVFARTQWKHRLRGRTTRPFAGCDAEREHRVTAALRAAGHGAPVPVAWGRSGALSVYVCRALPGRAFADLLAAGAVDGRLAGTVARHCGRLLAAGFCLPDLSADHVFVADDAAPLAVLDLHNGTVTAGRPGLGLLRIVLRRWQRSVRLLPVPTRAALRFAARLVHAAGRPGWTRTVLRTLPPFDTAARYDATGKSAAYAQRNRRRDARELDLLAAVWPGQRGETVLDLPCGAGRLLPLLRERFGHRVLQADGSLAMLHEARAAAAAGARAPAAAADALAMPFADRAVDGVVMFRFLHHLPPELRQRALAEAARVARRFVVVSFFHPCSVHHLRRRVRQWFGAPPTRFAVALGGVVRPMAAAGFELQATAADQPYARDLWLAAFARR
jgi:SAM-dependent methyltransferase